ncbi:MAG: repeat containing exported protein [Micavibrio sp.]|nr:repeat containing exported protein [Micavibrio sp.]
MRIRFNSVLLQTGAIAALLLFSGPAHAANPDTQAQIQRLENEIQTLSRAVFKGEQPRPGAISIGDQANQADMQNRISQLEMTIQQLTGKVEEQQHAINTLRDQLAKSGAGVIAPSGTGMTSVSTTTATVPPQPANPMMVQQPTATTSTYTYTTKPNAAADNEGFSMNDPDAPAPANAPTSGKLGSMVTNVDQNGTATDGSAGTPTGEYEAAYTLLKNQDYAAAQAAFDAFIKKYPDNSLVPNAKYWTGETYYVRNNFDQATRVFAETYQKYPNAPKAPDTLLKLGMSLAGQGKTKDACIALAQLKKQYPAGSAPVLSRGDQELTRLKCNAP